MATNGTRGFKLDGSISLAFSPDGRYLAAVGSHKVRVWDVTTKKRMYAKHFIKWEGGPDYSPDGSRLVVKSTSGQIATINASDGSLIKDFANKTDGEGTDVFYCNGGANLIDASWKGILIVRDSTTGVVVHHEQFSRMIGDLTINADRQKIAFNVVPPMWQPDEQPRDQMFVVRRWPFSNNSSDFVMSHRNHINCLSMSPSGSRLAVLRGPIDGALDIVDLSSGNAKCIENIHAPRPLRSLAWSPDESVIACSHRDAVSLFATDSLAVVHRIDKKFVSDVCFSPDGRLLALGDSTEGEVIDLHGVCM